MNDSVHDFGRVVKVGLFALTLTFALSGAARAGGLVCPGKCVGGTNHGGRCFAATEPADCPGAGAICNVPPRCVYLEFRPPQVLVGPGREARVQLWAYSSDGFDVPIEVIDIILGWDETRLQLLGVADPCLTCAGGINDGSLCGDDTDCSGGQCLAPDSCFDMCPSQTYNWFSSFFPDDCGIDGANAPCPGFPANDGNAFYEALSQILCGADPAPPAFAEPLGGGSGGLHITTVRFQPLIQEGGVQVSMLPSFGEDTTTRVVGGDTPGLEVTGLLGAPVQIIVTDVCDPPSAVSAVGCRYIEVTPPASVVDPVALRVTGSGIDPDVSCVVKYVQPSCTGGTNNSNPCTSGADCPGGVCDNSNGVLSDTAVYLTPAEWGTVAVRGGAIQPSKDYNVSTDCGVIPGDLLSDPVSVTLRPRGDAAGNGLPITFQDISLVVDAFRQVSGIEIEATDLLGPTDCTPQRFINFQDISGAVDAFRGFAFDCPPPCP